MGIEIVLILFGLIAGSVADNGSKLDHVAGTCLTIGVVMLVVELAIALFIYILGFRNS